MNFLVVCCCYGCDGVEPYSLEASLVRVSVFRVWGCVRPLDFSDSGVSFRHPLMLTVSFTMGLSLCSEFSFKLLSFWFIMEEDCVIYIELSLAWFNMR